MMSKVYISFLGTSDYTECMYGQDAEEERAVRFVQESTLRQLCRDWTSDDRGFIFTTQEAKTKNWYDDGHWDRENNCPQKCEGLETRISGLNLAFPVGQIDIPEGFKEAEIWDIFDIVYGVLNQGDEVIFDITHAFRSIPLLAIVILNYAKVMKGINLLGIYYGAFEALGQAREVKELPVDKRIAPLLDLTPLVTLADWTAAIDRFIGAGDASGVSALARKAAAPVMAKSRGKDAAAGSVKGIADALGFFSKQLSTCRGPRIVDAAKFVISELSKNETIDFVKPLVPLLKHVAQKIAPFTGNPVKDGIQAAQWCLDHGMIQQGFTILQETLVSFIITACGKDELDVTQRTIASNLAGVLKRIPESEWKGVLKEDDFQRDVSAYREILATYPDIIDMWRDLTEYRNDMNHAGFRKQSLADSKFQPKLNELIRKAESLFQ